MQRRGQCLECHKGFFFSHLLSRENTDLHWFYHVVYRCLCSLKPEQLASLCSSLSHHFTIIVNFMSVEHFTGILLPAGFIQEDRLRELLTTMGDRFADEEVSPRIYASTSVSAIYPQHASSFLLCCCCFFCQC